MTNSFPFNSGERVSVSFGEARYEAVMLGYRSADGVMWAQVRIGDRLHDVLLDNVHAIVPIEWKLPTDVA